MANENNNYNIFNYGNNNGGEELGQVEAKSFNGVNNIYSEVNNVGQNQANVYGGINNVGQTQNTFNGIGNFENTINAEQNYNINGNNLPIKNTFWSKLKSVLFREVKIELTPYQKKVEKEVNDFLYQEITWEKVHDFLFQEIKFGKKK